MSSVIYLTKRWEKDKSSDGIVGKKNHNSLYIYIYIYKYKSQLYKLHNDVKVTRNQTSMFSFF